jgi:hypothetical protein
LSANICEPIPTDGKICESKLYKKDNHCWFLDVVVEKDIPEKLQYQNVIGIDMVKQRLHNIAENAIRKVYGRYKDCLPVLNVVKRMLIEMPLSILPFGL